MNACPLPLAKVRVGFSNCINVGLTKPKPKPKPKPKMELRNIKNLLSSQNYICDDKFARKICAALATKPVAGAFLRGAAGTGKTALPAALAKGLGKTLLFQQCFPGSREDDFLFKMMPDAEKASGISMHDGVIVQAIRKSHSSGVVLVLDEWDKTRPSADSFLLDFLQSGRVVTARESLTANLSNLVVFITMNDEREISEPLLRRLPMIDFPFLSPSRVREALMLTHSGHPQLEAAVDLYAKTVAAGLPKPATIQELRQLLDAITNLGGDADWNELVYMFITKTREQHEMLAQSQYEDCQLKNDNLPEVDPEAFSSSSSSSFDTQNEEEFKPKLPQIRIKKSIIDESGDTPPVVDETKGGVMLLTEEAYNAVVSISQNLTDSATSLDVAEVGGGIIVIKKPIHLSKALTDARMLWGNAGEIVFISQDFDVFNIKVLQQKGLVIVKYTSNEIIGKYGDSVFLRWTPDVCEVVCDLQCRHDFEYLFKDFKPSKTTNQDTPPTPPTPPSPPPLRRRTKLGDEVITLTPNHSAIIRVEKVGFQPPHKGNKAIVKCSVLLPVVEDRVAPEIRFELKIFNNWIDAWSKKKGSSMEVIAEMEFMGNTYADAIHEARVAAHKDIVKLILAIRNRRKAIEEAERSIA